jgi:hypothetical protein
MSQEICENTDEEAIVEKSCEPLTAQYMPVSLHTLLWPLVMWGPNLGA